jgi:radical SAM protein with 4Fe4S-binding SPASM domain
MLNDKYPVLADGYHINLGLHVNTVSSSADSKKKGENLEINQDSLDIIKNVDGRNSFRDIATILSKTYDMSVDEINKIVEDFIVDNPIFKINDKPLNESYLPVKGSSDLQVPSLFSIELTNYCNYKCRHCYNDSNPDKNEFINVDGLISFLEFVKDFDPTIELTGGEPFSHPEIRKIIDYCCNNFSHISVITNGSLVKNHINFLSKYSNLSLLISLYSYREEYMDWFTNTTGYFNLVLDNMRKLVSESVPVCGTMLITPDNVKDIYPTVKMIKDLGADSFRTGIIMPVGRAKGQGLDFTVDNIDEFNIEAEKTDKVFGDFMRKIPEYLLDDPSDRINCGAGVNLISIKYNGKVRLCTMIPDFDKFDLGDIFNDDPWLLFKRIGGCDYHTVQEPKKIICGDCDLLTFCEGCIARGLYAHEENDCVWYETVFKPQTQNIY